VGHQRNFAPQKSRDIFAEKHGHVLLKDAGVLLVPRYISENNLRAAR